jgi:hypothetical protein
MIALFFSCQIYINAGVMQVALIMFLYGCIVYAVAGAATAF